MCLCKREMITNWWDNSSPGMDFIMSFNLREGHFSLARHLFLEEPERTENKSKSWCNSQSSNILYWSFPNWLFAFIHFCISWGTLTEKRRVGLDGEKQNFRSRKVWRIMRSTGFCTNLTIKHIDSCSSVFFFIRGVVLLSPNFLILKLNGPIFYAIKWLDSFPSRFLCTGNQFSLLRFLLHCDCDFFTNCTLAVHLCISIYIFYT